MIQLTLGYVPFLLFAYMVVNSVSQLYHTAMSYIYVYIIHISFKILYVSIMSPCDLLYTRVGRSRYLNLSSQVKCFIFLFILIALRCTFSNQIKICLIIQSKQCRCIKKQMYKINLAQEFNYNTEHNKVYMLPNNKTYKHYFIAQVD